MSVMERLKRKSMKDTALFGLVVAVIAVGICFAAGGRYLPKTFAPKTLAELTPENMEGAFVEDDIYYFYTPYLEEERYRNGIATGEITGVQYVVDFDDNYFMGLSIHKSYLDKAEEMMEACDQFYDGTISAEQVPVFHVKGTVMAMDQEEKGYFHEMAGGRQEVLDAMLPYYINMDMAGNVQISLMYVFCGIAALVVLLVAYRFVKAAAGGYQKKLKAKLAAMGDPAAMEERLTRFYDSVEPVGGVRLGEEFVMFEVGAESVLVRPWEVLWAYQSTTQHRTNGIPSGKSHAVVLCMSDGKRISLSMKEKKVKELLPMIAEKLPGTVVGYTKELEHLYEQNRGAFLEKWEQARPGCTAQV